MKFLILMSLFNLGQARGLRAGNQSKERNCLKELLAKSFQTTGNVSNPVINQNPANIVPDDSFIDFGTGFTFNLLAFVFPPSYLVQNVLQLVLARTIQQPSVWDQIKEKVEAAVSKAVTVYHRDSLYVKIQVLESRFFSLWSMTIKHNPSGFVTETVELHTDMYNSRLEFSLHFILEPVLVDVCHRKL